MLIPKSCLLDRLSGPLIRLLDSNKSIPDPSTPLHKRLRAVSRLSFKSHFLHNARTAVCSFQPALCYGADTAMRLCQKESSYSHGDYNRAITALVSVFISNSTLVKSHHYGKSLLLCKMYPNVPLLMYRLKKCR